MYVPLLIYNNDSRKVMSRVVVEQKSRDEALAEKKVDKSEIQVGQAKPPSGAQCYDHSGVGRFSPIFCKILRFSRLSI
jgi:hypothetical protein